MKNSSLYLVICFCIFLWGCSETPDGQKELQPTLSQSEIEQQLVHTPEPTKGFIDGGSAGRGYEEIFELKILEVCLSYIATPIVELDIDSRYYLVVEPADSEVYSGPWSLLGSSGELSGFG